MPRTSGVSVMDFDRHGNGLEFGGLCRRERLGVILSWQRDVGLARRAAARRNIYVIQRNLVGLI
jgi:hypothetical protein